MHQKRLPLGFQTGDAASRQGAFDDEVLFSAPHALCDLRRERVTDLRQGGIEMVFKRQLNQGARRNSGWLRRGGLRQRGRAGLLEAEGRVGAIMPTGG